MAFLVQSSGTGENIIERNVGILVMIKETRQISTFRSLDFYSLGIGS